jgi:predicted membrane protein
MDEERRTLIFGGSLSRRSQPAARVIFGLVVITFGLLFTLDNFGMVDARLVLRFWPVALMAYGLLRLTGLGARQNTAAGVIFTLIGLWLLLGNLNVVRFGLWDLWPLILVILGVVMVTGGLSRRRGLEAGPDPTSTISAFAMWSGTERKVTSQDFRGGDVTAVMGGHEIDLRSAKTTGAGAVLDLLVWWGGVVLIVPEDWTVSCDALVLMGGIEDHSRPSTGEPKGRVTLRGVIIMGGVEIKN